MCHSTKVDHLTASSAYEAFSFIDSKLFSHRLIPIVPVRNLEGGQMTRMHPFTLFRVVRVMQDEENCVADRTTSICCAVIVERSVAAS